MIKVRDNFVFSLWEQVNRIFETLIVALDLLVGSTKQSVIPVAKELNDQPEQERSQNKEAPNCREQQVTHNASRKDQQHQKLGGMDAHTIYQSAPADFIANDTAKKPS